MKYNDAYKLLNESMHQENPIIRQIIEGIIQSSDRGIPLLINRNPTISYGVAKANRTVYSNMHKSLV